MTEWILSFFSGIGTKVIVNKFLNKKNKQNNSVEVVIKNEQHLPIEKTGLSREKTEVEKLTDRFNHILKLMNKGVKVGVNELAQKMKLEKISELDNFFTGKDEPTFEFMQKFCEAFGINYEWLSKGVEHPYSNSSQSEHNPFRCFDKILNSKSERIYFIQANTEKAETFIVLKLSDYKYEILQQEWHISSHVGRGGTLQIMELYYLLRKLDIGSYSLPHYYGIILDKNNYHDLFIGDVFPGQYLHRPKINHWCEDIIDIYYKYPIGKNKYSQYGKSFTDAQNIIRYELEYNKKCYDYFEKNLREFKESKYKFNSQR